ncbi:DNA repair protein RecN [Isachenkonia alkalipeptolytica]|uniref:DNA repair protein RecN n=2 Tax=Isachenkonia alkalipeptolytica TaxID=2565777 RepID=A0AA43XLX1_9CLOT|nr:DNA repair protein RecN [Isachenkonia alkalipeptolytica]
MDMLMELEIKNFALIDHLHIRFDDGLNILTGETGVGKSIIINAIKLTLGERADKDHIRSKGENTYLQSVFLKNPLVEDLLTSLGLNTDEEIIVLSRELLKSGRSVSRINGSIVTNTTVKNLADNLIDIHGQHNHQSLLNKQNHIDILDDYAGEEMKSLRKDFLTHYEEFQMLQQEKNNLSIDDRDRERQIDLLRFHIEEIESAELKDGEEEVLMQDYNVLANSEKIYEVMGKGYENLYNLRNANSVMDLVSKTVEEFHTVDKFDPQIKNFSNQLEEIQFQLEDVSREIRQYFENIEFPTEDLDRLNQRIAYINDMKRKYGPSIEDVLTYYQKSKEELDGLINSKERIEKISKKLQKKSEVLNSLASALHKRRVETAKILEKKVSSTLQELNIPHGSFKVAIASKDGEDLNLIQSFNRKGFDAVEFLIKTNPGEVPKSLAKIASGGEISRVMLALKSLLADIDKISCMIFDEIDTGISGETANLVGDKLEGISTNRQVICITHLPQIAARGSLHYKIYKETHRGHNTTYLQELGNDGRIEEIGRLLGGTSTAITLKHAEELLKIRS